MSQWNNSYAYNNQYQQDSNGWNGDPGSQHMNQAYYNRQDANGQYVSFNEFLNQIQNSNTAPQTNNQLPNSFTNVQYDNYSSDQYNYMPSSSQTQLNNVNFGTPGTSNEAGPYPQSQFRAPPPEPTYSNNATFKSNLTATALEFVPKGSLPRPSSSQNIPESSNSSKDISDDANEAQSNYGNSSDRNWRQRPPKSSEPKDKPVSNVQQDNTKGYGRNRDTSQRNNESNGRHNRNEDISTEVSTHSNEPDSRNQETNQQSYESNNVSQDPRQRNYDSNNRNQEPRSNRNQEPRKRIYNDKNQDTRKNNDSNSRNRDSSNYNSNDRGQESRDLDSNRYDSRNERRNQSKGNPKNKTKDDRTFYNSGISKDGQDVRGGRGENSGRTDDRNRDSDGWPDGATRDNYRRGEASRGDSYGSRDNYGRAEGSGRLQRNWAGTQRPRGDRREDDEQYANSYHQKEERERRENERTERAYDRGERDKGYDRDRGERDKGYDRDRGFDRQDRDKQKNIFSPPKFKSKQQVDLANKEMTQRERLTDQLDKGTLECLVCCDRVRLTDPVWSCSNCFHVLHLKCIRKWAMSSVIEGKWRCPACQNISKKIPTEYRCMCGAMRSPEYQRGSAAHTCGKACKRERTCPHPCTLLCHPGPCPPCQATVSKQCGCGAETRSVMCSSKLPQVCGRTCSRTLPCNVHQCAALCHEDACAPCDKTVTQVCYCAAATERTVPCTRETGCKTQWECERACARILACGAHVCRAPCHAPPCQPCALLPQAVRTCPCGKMQLDTSARKSCSDPIPLCGNICAKPLPCGPANDKHFCKLVCHEGACPVCPDTTLVQCRCGHSSREVPCGELADMMNNVLCQKKCNKKLSCGRHRCRNPCCDATSHRCTVLCARHLPCGLHRCEELCHTGHCPPCTNFSFDELHCECGASVLMPPVPCGARAPPCEGPCPRPRACSHPPHHSCHSGECPPCVVLTTKRCYGGHEERKTIPCSLEEFSCGLPCGKPLPCGKHNCIKTCHKGPCDAGKCTQPCTEKRPTCGHPCNAACHSSAAAGGAGAACPSSAPCRAAVRAACPCGRRAAPRSCHDNAKDLARIMSALAATKMQEGGAIEITEQRPANMLKTLECDDECRVEARTRQMALALQIRNPDVSAKLAPRYSDHLRTTAQREPSFAQQIHDKLTDLVQLAKKSKQKTRAHSFPSMNWQKRQFIHELCEHFGCESVAYDAEPNRNVVATADKEKSWLPAMSVLEVLGREAGKRRVPGPVLRAPPQTPAAAPSAAKSASGWATLTSSKSTNAWAARSKTTVKPEPKPEPKIDYFDNPPDN